MNDGPVYVSLEFTPNPNTLKYSVNRTLLSRGAASFSSEAEAEKKSPLAAKLLGVEGIDSVMLGRDFVTVTKSETGNWDHVHKTASQLLEEHLTRGEPVLLEGAESENASGHGGGNTELESKIKDFLDREIRPAVAMDGGDITFDRFEDGIVYLFLQGSCSGCPSSTMTLKMGIETRIKQVIPEVREVVSV
jgi:Fe-S cluster biogenesis protein NfuA